MSAQAVLSMMAPAVPATPRGSLAAATPGFESLLAKALSEDDAAPAAETGKAAAPAEEAAKDSDGPADSEAGTSVVELPVALMPITPTSPRTGTEAGHQDGTDPQVLPGPAPSKAAEPLVLPGAEVGEGTELQILARPANARGAKPSVPFDAVTAKGAEPQVLPGTATDKGAEPQILPAEPPIDAAPLVARGAEMIETPPSGDVPPAPVKRGAAPVPAVLPPLRPLAERTSKPVAEVAKSADAAPSATDAKAAGPTAPQSPTQTQTDHPATAIAPAPVSPPPDDPAAAPAEVGPAADTASPATETAAPVRNHALSTLSRAAVEATAQIAAHILRKLEGRSTRFEIALRPDELGRVDVKLDIDSEGRLAARLAFDNPAAAADLRGRADELRRQLEAAGFQLADDAFEFAERDSGSSAFDRGQDARHGQSRAFAAAARLNNEIDVAQPPKWLALSLSPSGVDMKV